MYIIPSSLQYDSFLFEIFTFFNSEQPINGCWYDSEVPPPSLVTLSGILIVSNFVQPVNAPALIYFTPLGITIFVKFVQPENVHAAIVSTFFGIIILFNFVL